MATSSDTERRGFFAYYRKYAKSGIHGASAALMTGFGLLAAEVNSWFVVLAIAVYVLPPIFLYLTGEGENVPTVVGDDSDGDEHEPERGNRDVETDRHGDDSATARDFDTDSTENTDRTDTEPDSATGAESATRTADSGDTDGTGATVDGRSTDESETSSGETDESASEADFVPSKAESTTERDASSQRDIDEEPSSAGRASTADDTAVTDEPESAVHEPAVEKIAGDESDTEPGWTEADTPTDQSLLDVVSVRNGAYAVGESGVVLARDGEEWEVALERGPTTESNPLRGVDATADGETVWFAGDSGVLGRYEDGRLTDHSAPKDQTSTWEDIAVTGETGEEWIHLVNGSGELLRGEFEDGSVSWGDIEQPGSGSSISTIEFLDSDRGHICDTNQCVYATTDGGESYEKIGIGDANAAFTGVAATDSTVVVAGDDGSVFRYDGAVWTQLRAGSALSAIDLTDETGLAAGDSGAVYELTDGSWESVETPSDADLHGVVIAPDNGGRGPDVAVGTDGTVIERYR